MSQLLGSDFRLIRDESDDVFPADAHEAADVDFLGRTVTELTGAVKTLVGVLALRDTVRDVHQLRIDREVTDREVNDLVEERIAKWTQVAFDSSTSDELRAIAKKGRDTWYGGTVDV